MPVAVSGLWILLALVLTPTVAADVYKYVDAQGNTYFTDSPLKGDAYRLEWRRTVSRLAGENQAALSGLNVHRSTPLRVPEPSASMRERRAAYDPLIRAYARRYRLSPELLHAMIRAESAYNPRAVSRAGAQGLMQLMPDTAARYGVKNSFDPAENIRGGAAYLRDLLDLFDQDLRLALAGYNAGEGAVMKYGRKIPPFPETQAYVRKVMQFLWAERPRGAMLSER